MAISDQILRIQTDRNTMRTKLVDLGLVQSTADLDDIAAAVDGIANRGAVSVEILEGTTYTIPAGYHNGSGTVQAMTDTTGEAEKYKTQAKSVTPTKKQQSISPDTGYYALSAVTVEAIPENFQDVTPVTAGAADVLATKVIVDSTGKSIAGTMTNNGAVTQTLNTTTTSYTIPKGYHSGSGKVSITTETKTATPTKATQNITPSSGKVLSKVTVNPIPAAYQDVTSVDAEAADVLTGKTIVDAEGTEVSGTMPNRGAITGNVSTSKVSYTIPAGYHDGTGTVTARTTSKTVTPTKETQTVRGNDVAVKKEDGTSFQDKALLTSVTVNPIPDAYQDVTSVDAAAADVLTGKTIVDAEGNVVAGTMPNNGAVSAILDARTRGYTIPAGYHNGSGSVEIVGESVTVTPNKGIQEFAPVIGSVYVGMTVKPIPDAYQDVTGVTATAANVLDGKYFVTSTGAKTEGTMPNNGAISKTIDGLSATSVTIPAGYTSGGTVSLTGDIETALAAI